MAQGMLQPYFLRSSSCLGQPTRFALTKKLLNIVLSTLGSVWVQTFSMSWCQQESLSLITLSNASRWRDRVSPANLLTRSMTLPMLFIGSLSR